MLHNQTLFDRRLTVRMDRVDGPPKLPEGLKSVGPGLAPNGSALTDISSKSINNRLFICNLNEEYPVCSPFFFLPRKFLFCE